MYNQMSTFNTTQYGYISIYLLNFKTNIMILSQRTVNKVVEGREAAAGGVGREWGRKEEKTQRWI